MKIISLLTAANLAVSSVYAEQLFNFGKELTKTVTTTKAPSGATVETTSWDDHSQRIINFPSKKFTEDWEQQAGFISRMAEHIRDQKLARERGENADEPLYNCIDRMGGLSPGETMTFLPTFVAELSPSNPTSSYTSTCFG